MVGEVVPIPRIPVVSYTKTSVSPTDSCLVLQVDMNSLVSLQNTNRHYSNLTQYILNIS